jgi:phospholipid/cholesterol/gamma-HCH transport system permease protein
MRAISGREALRSVSELGFDSLAVTLVAAVFTGGILVVQAGLFVRLLGAGPIVGWASGYAILREFGPLFTAMVFSGRVGARNAAELATLRSGEQLDGLRALSLDPVWLLVVPRAAGIVLSAVALTLLADLTAITSGALFGRALLGVELGTFVRSFSALLHPADLGVSAVKAAAFGVAVAAISSACGLAAEGGARGVGAAAARSVVLSAFAILALDFLLTGGTA